MALFCPKWVFGSLNKLEMVHWVCCCNTLWCSATWCALCFGSFTRVVLVLFAFSSLRKDGQAACNKPSGTPKLANGLANSLQIAYIPKNNGGLFIFGFFFRGRFCFVFGFLVLCFPVSLFFLLFLLLCFSASLLFCFLLSLLLCFSCFSAFLLCFSAFCLSCFFSFLLLCFPCFSAFVLLVLSIWSFLLLLFYFFFSSVMCFCCATSCSFASLLPVFTVSLFFIFVCFIYSALFVS